MAAQPPRPPPNNLLFCGPPPALPHVLLLPSDSACANGDLQIAPSVTSQTNDADALHEINNVGVPTYEGLYDDRVELIDRDENIEYQLPPESYLRRTRSFDGSEIYAANIAHEFDSRAFQHSRSEPDLSKYGLFAEVTMECTPIQPPPLVLNNPFYDGSYALDPSQLNPTMVMLPENYLAFEDSFVPSWDCKPEYLIDRNMNPDFYYDGLPLIPSNDPWSIYCNENAAFEYYSPNFEAPLQGGSVHYTPLTDLDYAIPQYMSLPVVEQAKMENYESSSCKLEDTNQISVNEPGDQNNNNETNIHKTDVPMSGVTVSDIVSEDEKVSAIEDFSAKGSSTQSEESLNDISNDVTSSLAFVPSSKSSQRPDDTDDTSDDTSPCSTDYHEASALDLVQSLEELSCCDSTDFSQSRDDVSSAVPEPPKPMNAVTIIENQNVTNAAVIATTTASNLPLNKLPSIPFHEQPPTQIPPVPNRPEKEPLKPTVNIEQISPNLESNKKLVPVPEPEATKTNETSQCNNTNQQLTEPCARDHSTKVNDNVLKVAQQPPVVPPAVPPSWLAPRPPASSNQTNVVHPPQIRVQNAEGKVTDLPKNPKITSQPPVKTQPPAVEPQPSCSFVPQQPTQSLQLKPEKQSKEVEVSQQIITIL